MNRRSWLIVGVAFAAGLLVALAGPRWYASRAHVPTRRAAAGLSPVYLRDSSRAPNASQHTAQDLVVVVSPSAVECLGQTVSHAAAAGFVRRLLREHARTEIVVRIAPDTVYGQVVDVIDRLRAIGADFVWLELADPIAIPERTANTASH